MEYHYIIINSSVTRNDVIFILGLISKDFDFYELFNAINFNNPVEELKNNNFFYNGIIKNYCISHSTILRSTEV